ncbi:MAG: BamA/TamA family outer membrane protein, partial [Gemmatimonadetes bacterium]|nr:BamA/TamA family outer membrane protein [Gemmatimonadota bacterium]
NLFRAVITQLIEAHQGRIVGTAGDNILAEFSSAVLAVRSAVAVQRALDPEEQIQLGGDSGLRGYPLRYQTGTSRGLFTLEQRLYSEWFPFRLFYVGGAVFFDAGRTWGRGAVGSESRGWLKDVGIGLRLGNARGAFGSVLHFDIAFPLDRTSDIDSVQFLVETKQSF